MKRTFIVVLSVITLSSASCMFEKGDITPKVTECDTVVSYSATIVPLLVAQCVPCHSGPFPAGGYDFTTYEPLKARADDGTLREAVVKQKTMPQPGSGYDLTEEERLKFSCWITQGAANN